MQGEIPEVWAPASSEPRTPHEKQACDFIVSHGSNYIQEALTLGNFI